MARTKNSGKKRESADVTILPGVCPRCGRSTREAKARHGTVIINDDQDFYGPGGAYLGKGVARQYADCPCGQLLRVRFPVSDVQTMEKVFEK